MSTSSSARVGAIKHVKPVKRSHLICYPFIRHQSVKYARENHNTSAHHCGTTEVWLLWDSSCGNRTSVAHSFNEGQLMLKERYLFMSTQTSSMQKTYYFQARHSLVCHGFLDLPSLVPKQTNSNNSTPKQSGPHFYLDHLRPSGFNNYQDLEMAALPGSPCWTRASAVSNPSTSGLERLTWNGLAARQLNRKFTWMQCAAAAVKYERKTATRIVPAAFCIRDRFQPRWQEVFVPKMLILFHKGLERFSSHKCTAISKFFFCDWRQISTFMVQFILKEPYCKQQSHSVCPEHLSCTVWWKKIDLVALRMHPWNANFEQEVSEKYPWILKHAYNKQAAWIRRLENPSLVSTLQVPRLRMLRWSSRFMDDDKGYLSHISDSTGQAAWQISSTATALLKTACICFESMSTSSSIKFGAIKHVKPVKRSPLICYPFILGPSKLRGVSSWSQFEFQFSGIRIFKT